MTTTTTRPDGPNDHNRHQESNAIPNAPQEQREAIRAACIDLTRMASEAGWDYTLQSDAYAHGPTYTVVLWAPAEGDDA